MVDAEERSVVVASCLRRRMGAAGVKAPAAEHGARSRADVVKRALRWLLETP
jgi:hypothetical protein